MNKRLVLIAVLIALSLSCSNKGVLSIEAGVVYKMGGMQPVARVTFHLLDDDLENILQKAGYTGDKGSDVVTRYAIASQFPDQNQPFYGQAKIVIQSHIVQSVTTDFSGKAQFEGVPSGRYYIMGVTETRGGFAFWNLRVDVKPGKNSVVLDQNNAVMAL